MSEDGRMPRTIGFILGAALGALSSGWCVRAPGVFANWEVPKPSPGAVTMATATTPMQLARAASATTPAPAPGPVRISQLSAERILLDEAHAALAQGNPGDAIVHLERHRCSFGAPILGEERDAMWIEALVKGAAYDDARQRAAAFGDRFPDSIFLSGVESVIAAIPQSTSTSSSRAAHPAP